MSPKTFAAEVHQVIIEDSNKTVQDLFKSTPAEEATDPYWKRALVLYHSLDQNNRTVLFEIIRQAKIDAISELFGILDGVSSLESSEGELILMGTEDNQKINGSLQDHFLETDEKISAGDKL